MATLEKIRKQGALVAIVIGLALLAFILGDAVRSSGYLFSESEMEIAEVGDESLNVQDYQKKVEETIAIYEILRNGALDNQTRQTIREQVWEEMIRTLIMDEQYDEVGVGVSSEELFALVQGDNPAPLIRQLFSDPQTGQFNRQAVINFVSNLDRDPSGQNKRLWLYLEDQVAKNQRFSKYLNLASKGLYAPTPLAQHDLKAQQKTMNFDYLQYPLSAVGDSAVEVSQSDIKDYYKAHKKEFQQTQGRDIQFIVFEATPTKEDTANNLTDLNQLKPDFEKTANEAQFIHINSELPFDDKYYKKGELEDSIMEAFAFNNELGTIKGPYREDGYFKLTKIADAAQLPDSARASEILITLRQQTQEAYTAAKELADSLREVAESGADFSALASEYSQGPEAPDGGDLGWFSEEEKPAAIVDSTFFNETGDVAIVETQQGIHVLKVTAQGEKSRAVQLATLARRIEAGKETLDKTFSNANKFIAENKTLEKFQRAASEQGLTVRRANNLEPLAEQIAQIENAREVVNWAYNTKVGEVSSVFEINNLFIVATLSAVREEGIAPLESVQSVISQRVTREKKLDYLAQKLKETQAGKQDIYDIASALNLSVKSASEVTLSSGRIENMSEPNVAGAADALEEGELSEPVKGNNGVYLIKMNTINEPTEDANYFVNQNNLEQGYGRRANFQLYNAIKEAVGVDDKRAKFY